MKELRAYLEDLYPSADSELIDDYLSKVVNCDLDKLPPTQVVLDYIEAKRALKEAETLEEKLKAQVIQQYKRLGCHQFSGLAISTPSPRRYDKDKLYEWVKTKYDPSFLDDCTSQLIDKDKVEQKIIQLIVKEEIKVEDLPDDIYSESSQTRISLSKK